MPLKRTIHFRKYVDEALGLGIFMFSAGFFDALINYPGLSIRDQLPSALLRRFLVGLSMGLTAFYIFTSPFGRKSGAYINPAITLVRYRLGNIDKTDGIFYIFFQFLGGALGMWFVVLLFPRWMKSSDVNYIVTVPGQSGTIIAFLLEFLLSFLLIVVVLAMEKKERVEKFAPLVVSTLITLFITFESPYSGMSINPARTFASAIVAGQWTAFWLYCIAPVSGMWMGTSLFLRLQRRKPATIAGFKF